jgi:hypothetical protein
MKWLLLFLCLLAVPAQAQPLVPRPTVAVTTIAGNNVLIPPQPNGIQVTAIVLIGAAGNVQFQYGTGVTCGTGTVPLTGTMAELAPGLIVGTGSGPIMSVPPNQALCASTSVAMNGWIAWATQ